MKGHKGSTMNLDRDMLVLMHDVARMMRTRFDQRARVFGMTRAQWMILARLERQPGMTQNEMAGLCEVEPITVGRLVDRLEARGMVERRLDPADRRIRRLHLLESAQPVLDEIRRYKNSLFADVTAGLDEKAIETVVHTLLHMKERLATEPGKTAGAGE